MRFGRCTSILPRRHALMGAAAILLGDAARAAAEVSGAGESKSAQPATSPEAANPAVPERLDVLFLGDSLAQGLFLTLNPVLRRRPTPHLINGTLHATGVTRGDEYDWTTVSRDLAAQYAPQLVVFWIGANDFRPMVVREARTRYRFGTAGYAEQYAQRVGAMVGNATHGGAKAVWLGLPNMREAQFAGAVRQLNTIQQAAAETAGAIWIDTWEATSDAEGRYLPAVAQDASTHTFRAEDGVHFTAWGYRRIAALLFDQTVERFPELAAGMGRLPGV